MSLKEKDKKIFDLIEEEKERQNYNIELIASENFVSKEVLEAQGSILTNKYAEGYPGKRYYGGCEVIDKIETEAIERLKKLFNAKYANVQPHSGSGANLAAYKAVLKAGDKVMGMALDQGGHLTHGSKVSFSGQDYMFKPYFVDKETETIDYQRLEEEALDYKPKLIVAGASNYSRMIDFKKLRKICDKVGCLLMVDIAHIAGLVAVGLHQNPIEYADVVTSTTHKTLRGPRGGIIMTNNEEIAKKVNKAIFPGTQGGPLEHIIAAKAVAFGEALKPEFKKYQTQLVKNCKAFCNEFINKGYTVVSGGTDNHVFTVNVKDSLDISGDLAEKTLDKIGITCNKNTVPYDTLSARVTSGIRLGTAAITTRGFKEDDMIKVMDIMDQALRNYDNDQKLKELKGKVRTIMEKFQ